MINLIVENDKLTIPNCANLNKNSVNYYTLNINYTNDWDNLHKFIVFDDGLNTPTVDEITNITEYKIPQTVLNTISPKILIGIYATNGSSSALKRITTNMWSVRLSESSYKTGTTPAPPTADVWEKYMASLGLKLENNSILKITASGVSTGTPVVLPTPSITIDQIVTPTSQNAISSKAVSDFVGTPDPATNVYDYDIASLKAIKPHRFAKEYLQPAKMFNLTATSRQGNVCEILINLVISSIDLSSLSTVNDNVDKYMTAELTNIPKISSYATFLSAQNYQVDSKPCDNLIDLKLLDNTNIIVCLDDLITLINDFGAISVSHYNMIDNYGCTTGINQNERFYQLFNVNIKGTFATQAESNAAAIEIQNFLDTMQTLRLELLPLSTPKKGVPTL